MLTKAFSATGYCKIMLMADIARVRVRWFELTIAPSTLRRLKFKFRSHRQKTKNGYRSEFDGKIRQKHAVNRFSPLSAQIS